MRATSLFIVFAVARLAILWGRTLPDSPWTPLAYLWQDAAVALAFAAFDTLVRREWAVRLAYVSLVALSIVNVPIARVLSSPLTMPMLRATRGTLSDSIAYHVTPANLTAMAIVLAAGIALPFILTARLARRTRIVYVAAAIVMTIAGRAAASRVDTAGLERHPLVALLGTSLPRIQAEAREADWRAGLDEATHGEDLSNLSRAAAGQNVLLVVLESTGAGYLRSYGAAEDPTPNLTTLAARSIVFEHAYAVYPESIKGLAAILASRYPAFDVPAERHQGLMSPSIASTLTAAGYDTALFHSGRFMYLGMDALVSHAGFGLIEDAGDIGGHHESSFGVDEASAVRRVLQWIDARPKARPFFAAYLPIAGHHPYTSDTPGPFAAPDDLGRYRNALFDGDRALGDLLDGLRIRGLDRSTLVIVMGDHGEAFGQHEGNYGHTLALWEENVRVPLLVSMPGGAARRVQRTASLIDVAPTVLDLLGLDAPADFQGASLLAARERMALFFTDYSLGLLGLRDGCTKYIDEIESGRSKLFDLCHDPDERVDLSPQFSDRVARYRERLSHWSAATVASVTRD